MIASRQGLQRLTASAIPVVFLASCISGSTHPLLESLQAFRDAKERGDYVAAETYLADDARIWLARKRGREIG